MEFFSDPETTDEEKLISLGHLLSCYDSREKRSEGYGKVLRFFIKPLMRTIKPVDYVFNIGRKRLRLQMNRTIPEGEPGGKIREGLVDYLAGALNDREAAARLVKYERKLVPSKYKDTYSFSEDFWEVVERLGALDDILWILNPEPSLYVEPAPKGDISQKKKKQQHTT